MKNERRLKFIFPLKILLCTLLAGCGGKPADPALQPLQGRWTYQDEKADQTWVYDFSGAEVCFTLDGDRKCWKITATRSEQNVIEIDVDGLLGTGANRNSRIKIERLGDTAISVSSGLHSAVIFKK